MSQKLFLDYFESLGAERLAQIYSYDPCCALFFFRMLPPLGQYLVQRLLQIEGPVPFQTEVRSWHPASQRGLQNKALWKLKQLQIIQGKANEIWLNPIFREAIVKSISGEQAIWTGSSSDINNDLVDTHFEKTWNGLLYCVTSGGKGHERYTKIGQNCVDLLLNAGLLTKERNVMGISKEGFQFIMADSSEQSAILLIQYLTEQEEESFFKALKIIFCLAFSSVHSFYPMSLLGAGESSHISMLSNLGFVFLPKRKNASGFIPTRLIRAISYTGDMPLMLTKEEGFLVLETNYKFYAYTDSPLHLSLLSLFMSIKVQFPNMIHGVLSQDSVHQALKKGLTAAQIVRFLTSSAHRIMRSNTPILPPTIVDQINLWELDRSRLKAKPGYMYQQFLSSADFEKTLAEANRIGAVLYANSASRILVVTDASHNQIKTFVKNNI